MPKQVDTILIDDFSGGLSDEADYLMKKNEASNLVNILPQNTRKLSKIFGFSHFGIVDGCGVDEFNYNTIDAFQAVWSLNYTGGGTINDIPHDAVSKNLENTTKLKIIGKGTGYSISSISISKTAFGIPLKDFVFEVKINHLSSHELISGQAGDDRLRFELDNGIIKTSIRFRNGVIKVYDINTSAWSSTLTTYNIDDINTYQFVFSMTDATSATVTLYKNGNNQGSVSYKGNSSESAGKLLLYASYDDNNPAELEIDYFRIFPAGEIIAFDKLRVGSTDYFFAMFPGQTAAGAKKAVLRKYDSSTNKWIAVTGGDIFTLGSKTHTLQINDELYFFNGIDDVYSVASNNTLTNRTTPANGIPKSKYATVNLGRLFVAGNSTNPNRIFYSNANVPNTFPATSYWDIGQAAVGSGLLSSGQDQITSLSRGKREIIAGRNNSIWSLVVTGDPTTNWDAYPISESVGMLSNRASVFLGNDIIYFSSDKKIRSVVRTAQDTFLNDSLNSKIDSFLNQLNVAKSDWCAMAISSRFLWLTFASEENVYNNKLFLRNINFGAFAEVNQIRPILFKIFNINTEDITFIIEDHIGKILKSDSTVFDVDGIKQPFTYRSPEFEFEDISKDKVLERLGFVVENLEEDISLEVKYDGESEWNEIGFADHLNSGGVFISDAVPIYFSDAVGEEIFIYVPGEVKFVTTDDRRRWRKLQVRLTSDCIHSKTVKINQLFLEAMIKNRRSD